MILTPILCFIFIRRGLHNPSDQGRQRKTSFLDLMQSTYNKSIDWCLRHTRITITGSLATILIAAVLLKTVVKQKFFPEAERERQTRLDEVADQIKEKFGQAGLQRALGMLHNVEHREGRPGAGRDQYGK